MAFRETSPLRLITFAVRTRVGFRTDGPARVAASCARNPTPPLYPCFGYDRPPWTHERTMSQIAVTVVNREAEAAELTVE